MFIDMLMLSVYHFYLPNLEIRLKKIVRFIAKLKSSSDKLNNVL